MIHNHIINLSVDGVEKFETLTELKDAFKGRCCCIAIPEEGEIEDFDDRDKQYLAEALGFYIRGLGKPEVMVYYYESPSTRTWHIEFTLLSEAGDDLYRELINYVYDTVGRE